MSGRSTAEIAADLRELAELRFADDLPSDADTMREAADRLTELDALLPPDYSLPEATP